MIEEEGVGVQLPETLGEIGAHPGARAPRHAHQGHHASQPVASLHLPPHQVLHHLSVPRAMDTVAIEQDTRYTRVCVCGQSLILHAPMFYMVNNMVSPLPIVLLLLPFNKL